MYNEPPVEMQDRPAGSTTLAQCGWCKHAMGTHRYGYCLSGICTLAVNAPDIIWSTGCRIKAASKSELTKIITRHEYDIASSKDHIARVRKIIAIIKPMIHKAVYRPPLPRDREYNHFNLKDEVIVFADGTWYKGVVKLGYRHHDGCVSYKLYNLGPQDGVGVYWGCGTMVPVVLLLSEAKFLVGMPEVGREWFRRACSDADTKHYNDHSLFDWLERDIDKKVRKKRRRQVK